MATRNDSRHPSQRRTDEPDRRGLEGAMKTKAMCTSGRKAAATPFTPESEAFTNAKSCWLGEAQGWLRVLTREANLPLGGYDLRKLAGEESDVGSAVLHGDKLYVSAEVQNGLVRVTYKAVAGRTDFEGGVPHLVDSVTLQQDGSGVIARLGRMLRSGRVESIPAYVPPPPVEAVPDDKAEGLVETVVIAAVNEEEGEMPLFGGVVTAAAPAAAEAWRSADAEDSVRPEDVSSGEDAAH